LISTLQTILRLPEPWTSTPISER